MRLSPGWADAASLLFSPGPRGENHSGGGRLDTVFLMVIREAADVVVV